MDTRRTPHPRDDGSKPELGTETVPVEMVELESVRSPGRGVTGKALLAIAAIGIVAFAAIMASARPPTSNPSPSAPQAGLASASPEVAATSRPSSFAPTPAPATPQPTAPPPWQWTRSDFMPGMNPSVDGLWSVDGRILALVRRYDSETGSQSWFIARRADDNAWDLVPAPIAIDELFAGVVVDDRLWFVARVGGITDADATWQVVSTADGETWDSRGAAEGLPALDGAYNLARTGDRWVMVTQRAEGEGVSNATISWSVDGRHWKPADVPDLRANVGYTHAASVGDVTVMLGFDFDTPEDTGWFALISTDGQAWRRSSFEPPPSTSPRDLACDGRTCLITLEPTGTTSSATQVLMASTDGDHWAEVTVHVPYDNPESTIGRVTATATGFIALTGSPARALLSSDGRSWREVEVLPPDAKGYISGLAVAGDTIVALVPSQSSEEPCRIWVGSLGAMGG